MTRQDKIGQLQNKTFIRQIITKQEENRKKGQGNKGQDNKEKRREEEETREEKRREERREERRERREEKRREEKRREEKRRSKKEVGISHFSPSISPSHFTRYLILGKQASGNVGTRVAPNVDSGFWLFFRKENRNIFRFFTGIIRIFTCSTSFGWFLPVFYSNCSAYRYVVPVFLKLKFWLFYRFCNI
jgi:hypothetical protein